MATTNLHTKYTQQFISTDVVAEPKISSRRSSVDTEDAKSTDSSDDTMDRCEFYLHRSSFSDEVAGVTAQGYGAHSGMNAQTEIQTVSTAELVSEETTPFVSDELEVVKTLYEMLNQVEDVVAQKKEETVNIIDEALPLEEIETKKKIEVEEEENAMEEASVHNSAVVGAVAVAVGATLAVVCSAEVEKEKEQEIVEEVSNAVEDVEETVAEIKDEEVESTGGEEGESDEVVDDVCEIRDVEIEEESEVIEVEDIEVVVVDGPLHLAEPKSDEEEEPAEEAIPVDESAEIDLEAEAIVEELIEGVIATATDLPVEIGGDVKIDATEVAEPEVEDVVVGQELILSEGVEVKPVTATDGTETLAVEQFEENVVSPIEPQVADDDLTEEAADEMVVEEVGAEQEPLESLLPESVELEAISEEISEELPLESTAPVERAEESVSAIGEETPEPNAGEPRVANDGVETVVEEEIEVKIEAEAEQAKVDFDEPSIKGAQGTEVSEGIAVAVPEPEDTVIEQEIADSATVPSPKGSSSLASGMPAIVASLAAVAAGVVTVAKVNATTEPAEKYKLVTTVNDETLDEAASVPEHTDVEVEAEDDVVFAQVVTSEAIVKALPVAEVVPELEGIEVIEASNEETEIGNNLEVVGEEATAGTSETSEAPVVVEEDLTSVADEGLEKAIKAEVKPVSTGIISDTPQIVASLALGACAVPATAVAGASTTKAEETVDEEVDLTDEEEEVIDDMIDATVEEVLSIASSDEQRDSLTDEAVDDFTADESGHVGDAVDVEDVESVRASPAQLIEDTAEVTVLEELETVKHVETSAADRLVDDVVAIEPAAEEEAGVEEETPEDVVQETITEVVCKVVESAAEGVPALEEPSIEAISIESKCEVKVTESTDTIVEAASEEITDEEVPSTENVSEPEAETEIVADVEVVEEKVSSEIVETATAVEDSSTAKVDLKQTKEAEVQPVSSSVTSEMPQIVASLALGACGVSAVALASTGNAETPVDEANSFEKVDSPAVEEVASTDAKPLEAGEEAVSDESETTDEMAESKTEQVHDTVPEISTTELLNDSDTETANVEVVVSAIETEAGEEPTVEEPVAVEPTVEFEETAAEEEFVDGTLEKANVEQDVAAEESIVEEVSKDEEVKIEAVETEDEPEAVNEIQEAAIATDTLVTDKAAPDVVLASEDLVTDESVAVAPEVDETIEEARPLESEENIGEDELEMSTPVDENEDTSDAAAVVNEEVDTEEAESVEEDVSAKDTTEGKASDIDAETTAVDTAEISQAVAAEEEPAVGAKAIEIGEPAVDSATEYAVTVEQESAIGETATKDGELTNLHVDEPVAKGQESVEAEAAIEKEPEQEEVAKAPSSGGWFKNLLFRKKPTSKAEQCVQQSAVKGKEDVADDAAETDTQIHATLSDVEVADEPVLDDLVVGVEEVSAAIPQDTPLEEEQALSVDMESAAVEIEHQKVETEAIPKQETQLKTEEVQRLSDTDSSADNEAGSAEVVKEEVRVVENEPEDEQETEETVVHEPDTIEEEVAEAEEAAEVEPAESVDVDSAKEEAVDAEVEAVEVEDSTTESAQVEAVETETQDVEAEELAEPATDNVSAVEATEEEAEVVDIVEEAAVEEPVENDVAADETEPTVSASVEEAIVAVDNADDKEPVVEVTDEEPVEAVVEEATEDIKEEDASATTDAKVVEENTIVEEVALEADAIEPVAAEPEAIDPVEDKDSEAKPDQVVEEVAVENESIDDEVVEEIPVETTDKAVEEVAAGPDSETIAGAATDVEVSDQQEDEKPTTKPADVATTSTDAVGSDDNEATAVEDVTDATQAEVTEDETVNTPTEPVSVTETASATTEVVDETVVESEPVVEEIAMDVVEKTNSSGADVVEEVAEPDNNTDSMAVEAVEVASQQAETDKSDNVSTNEANEAATAPTENVIVDDNVVAAVDAVPEAAHTETPEAEAATTSTESLETAAAAAAVEDTRTAELQSAVETEVETKKVVEADEEVTEDSAAAGPMKTEDVTVVEENAESVDPTPVPASTSVEEKPIEVAVASSPVNEEKEHSKPVEPFEVDTKPISAVAMLIGRFEKIAKRNAEEAASSRTSSRVSSRVSSPLPSPPTSFSRGNVFETAARNIEAVEKGEKLAEEKIHVDAIEEESNTEKDEEEAAVKEPTTDIEAAVEEPTAEVEVAVEEVEENESEQPDAEVVEATEEKDEIEETITDETAAVEKDETEEKTEVAEMETESEVVNAEMVEVATEREVVEAGQDVVETEAVEVVSAVEAVAAEVVESAPESETDCIEKQDEVSEKSAEVEATPVEEESADVNVVEEVVEAAVETSRETQTITTAYEAAESSILTFDTPEDNSDVTASASAATEEVEPDEEIPVEDSKPEVATADFTTNEAVEAYESVKEEPVPTENPETDNQIEEDPSNLASATKETSVAHEESKAAEPETERRMSSISPEAPTVQTDDTAMTNEVIAKATVEMAPTSQATKAVADDDEVAEKTPERDSTQLLPHEHVTYEILGVTRANNVIMYHIYTINSATGERSMSIPKRYSEFKLLDEQLRAMDIPTAKDLPELPKPSVGTFLRGRRSKKTIERREKAFGDFLHYITQHEELHECDVFQQFIAN